MAARNIRITYLYNSGFAIEIGDRLLIFDYCLDIPDGSERLMTTGVVSLENLKKRTSVTVFASHNHIDHFNAIVLRWRFKMENIHYVLSNDIGLGKRAIHLSAGDSTIIAGMEVHACPSTDAGISFLVKVDGFTIFHAGDLNIWNRTPTDSNNNDEVEIFAYRKAKIAFLRALKPIRDHSIDIAFFPVDPRIGEGYDTGAIYFARNFQPKLFVPMHFGEHYDVCEKFANKVDIPNMKVFCISSRGQQFSFMKS